MEFEEKIKIFSSNIKEKLKHIDTEETTKTALILPFLNDIMGYNIFNPAEVKAEYTADIGRKRGEKIDLAILNEGQEIILIECKSVLTTLEKNHLSQLYRYFNITDSEIGILTNGLIYQFYTDSIKASKMDKSPFLEINLLDLSERDIYELKKFTKTSFDITKIKSKVNDLKYAHDIHKILSDEIESPSDELVRVITRQAYDGIITSNVKDKFYNIIKKEFKEVIDEKVELRLNKALEKTNEDELSELFDLDQDKNIITTKEELEGYYIIKSIAAKLINPERVSLRDFKSYCNVLLDDNKHYPIVRLHFNNPHNMKLAVFDKYERANKGKKLFVQHNIRSVNEIYEYETEILNTVNLYLREIKRKNKKK